MANRLRHRSAMVPGARAARSRAIAPTPTEAPTAARSKIMASIKGTANRSTEQALATVLRSSGLSGWRRHANLPGRPDFVFPRERVAIFVDGCFWHGCPKCYKEPRRNVPFWRHKISANRSRDQRVRRALNRKGCSVLRVWEHSLTDSRQIRARISRALRRNAFLEQRHRRIGAK